jgi:riboflavin-specific deaminase-like protein
MHVVVSCAVSLDGYLDDGSARRLILSGPADLDRVDALRATCDAILVGANTVRRDNPRLRVRSPDRRQARADAGKPENPLRVTITGSGDLDPDAPFFGPEALVFTPPTGLERVTDRLGKVATVLPAEELADVLRDLDARGVERLLVEGGSALLTALLGRGHADELQVAIAPILVGGGVRFLGPGSFPPGRLRLTGLRQVDDVAVLTYTRPADDDRHWLGAAIAHAEHCVAVPGAYNVGAVVVAADGTELSRGYSRETGPDVHAEEVALARVDAGDPRLAGATLYSSMEPCGVRRSRPVPCAHLIATSAVRRVVYALREPPVLAAGGGDAVLRAAGVTVVEVPDLAYLVRRTNDHLIATF